MSLSMERGARFLLDRGTLRSRADCLHEICRCIVQSVPGQTILEFWRKSREDVSERSEAYPEHQDDVHERYSFRVIAAWTGDPEYLQATSELVPFCDSWMLWPASLTATAAYQGHIDVFRYLLKYDLVRCVLEPAQQGTKRSLVCF